MELQMVYFEGNSRLKEAAQICISNRLFVNRWQLRKWFGKLIADIPCSYIENIVIAYYNGKPVGVLTRSKMEKGDYVAAYVRATLRQKGIAKAMLAFMPSVEKPWAMTGIDRTGEVWNKMGVRA